jgi:hypothetical protein
MTWNGLEQPEAQDLLATARRVILDEIAPGLAGDARFKALMVANAIAIALRETPAAQAEIAACVAALGDVRSLIADIRSGGRDPGTALHAQTVAALTALAEARCRVSAPKALS